MAKKKDDDLDTETSFSDMNVEGFSWYDPGKKKRDKKEKVKLTKKEMRAMIKGAYLAMLPAICCVLLAAIIVFIIAYFWLKK